MENISVIQSMQDQIEMQCELIKKVKCDSEQQLEMMVREWEMHL